MKVILLKDTPGVGKKGSLHAVSAGYAHNFLIPKGFAVPATGQIQQKLQKEQREAVEKSERELKKFQAVKGELEKRVFTLQVKVGDKGQVFGGVREKDIADAINEKMNLNLDKNAISVNEPMRAVGEHVVIINLGRQTKADVKINIQPL